MCVCSLRYPACNAHAPYCHLWPAPLYNISPHYLTNGTIFEWKKNYCTEYKMCILISSTKSDWKISHSKNWLRCDGKTSSGVQVAYPLFFFDFNEKRIFRTISFFFFFKNCSHLKFHKNPKTPNKKMYAHSLRQLDNYCRQQDGRCVVCRRYDTGGGVRIIHSVNLSLPLRLQLVHYVTKKILHWSEDWLILHLYFFQTWMFISRRGKNY